MRKCSHKSVGRESHWAPDLGCGNSGMLGWICRIYVEPNHTGRV